MKHYVCTQCKGVSNTPGVCTTPDCSQEGAPLTACSCLDGNHDVSAIKKTKTAWDEDKTDGEDGEKSSAGTELENDPDIDTEQNDEGRLSHPGKTLDLDRGDDAIEGE